MTAKNNKKKNEITKIENVKMDKINVFYRRSILRQICKILLMEHSGFRTYKSVKNINKLFNHINMNKYSNNPELEAYIWVICFASKQWLDGVTTPDIIAEVAKSRKEYNNVIEDIFNAALDNSTIITAPEANSIFNMISDALQFGFIASLKDEYIDLLEDIDMNEPGAFKKVVERLFLVSKSLMDICYNTNMVSNKIEFSTADNESIRNAISSTVKSLTTKGCILKTGIRRLNTLLSPGYMNGKLYIYAGLPGSYKSGILLQSVLDIRRFNPNFPTKTPGMKPCCLYITMENTFMETIERLWMMIFDDPITNYDEEQAIEMLCRELGIGRVVDDAKVVRDDIEVKVDGETLLGELIEKDAQLVKNDNNMNIEIVLQYYPYRSISTDDLYTIINDLREENLEICALVFDYIKRIEPANPVKDNERLEIDHITNELKALAVIENIPVISAHQLNRLGATAIDNAEKAGKHDLIKEANRDNIGGAWAVAEIADFLAFVGTEYKSGTDEKFFTIKVAKRRRIDASEVEFAKFTYLAHPFSKKNPFRLIPDMNTDKVLSVQSLATDIDLVGVNKEKSNATPRLQIMKQEEFSEDWE